MYNLLKSQECLGMYFMSFVQQHKPEAEGSVTSTNCCFPSMYFTQLHYVYVATADEDPDQYPGGSITC